MQVAYLKSCKCWLLHLYVHLVPEDPDGNEVEGSLDSIAGNSTALMDQVLDIGEVSVSYDGPTDFVMTISRHAHHHRI